MTSVYIPLALFVAVVAAWFYGQGQAVRLRIAAGRTAHSRTPYHGALCALAAILAGGLGLAIAALVLSTDRFPAHIHDTLLLASALIPALLVALVVGRRLGPDFAARVLAERLARWAMLGAASLALLVSLGIVLTLLVEALLFFGDVSVLEFLFGTQWSPQSPIRDGQAVEGGQFGSLPVFAGTLFIALIAIAVAGPIGLMIAVYLSEYAAPKTRAVLKPTVEILAGIPPVVYGFFALIAVGPAIQSLGGAVGLSVTVQSALSAGLVMGLMILPLVSSLSDDVISAVPQALRDGSLALGATRSETVREVLFPSALPGIVGAFLLAISRAIGETMIVVMAAGRAANFTANPLETVTTVTVQIVALLTGDQVFDSAKTRAAFALGLVLFALTLAMNAGAQAVVRRYRERAA